MELFIRKYVIMIRHFFLDKTNTIVKGSMINMGLNPIMQIAYGNGIMRGLIHFDIEEIKKLIEDKTFADTDKLTFTLNMTNCFSVDTVPYEKDLIRGLMKSVHRAGSFNLMLFKLPCRFDQGRGFEYVSDFWNHDKSSYSENASNWFLSEGQMPWPYEREQIDFNDPTLNWVDVLDGLKGGIYDQKTIIDEYNKFLSGETSIVVGIQHFDFGNENLSIDITDYVMDCVNGAENYGLAIAFTPDFESLETEEEQYVGFFDDNTNTFFHPYVEAVYSDFISDDRNCFTVGTDNKLYLYASNDGNMINLDNIPTCTIDGKEFISKQVGKGVYCAEIPAYSLNVEEGMLLYDEWSNIALNGHSEPNVEMEVSVQPKIRKINIGSLFPNKKSFVPIIYGINDEEKITRDEIRGVSVDFRQLYEKEKGEIVDGAEWRLYVKDGNRELDVFPYHPIERTFLHNFFIINTCDLIPNEYYVDIKVKSGVETKYYRRSLKFTIVSNITKRYE